MDERPVGRRERKKAATRQALADAALRLFLEHGYDRVSIRDIAEVADVSTTTLFKHFPGKEALVFDQEEDRDAQLVAAIRDRPDGQSIPDALRRHVLDTYLPVVAHPLREDYTRLVDSTPALRDYSERMWTRHTETLAAAIADDLGVPHDNLECVTLARFVLDIPSLTRGRPDQEVAVETVFAIITDGWHARRPGSDAATPDQLAAES
ncbi:TetR family transcriptional regulator [Actinoplanes sp. SE50]|uniref:TetR/AcrR family transcriptional regulator n=1 Tax=unclassified Actinoplanes TaxID=2626549 RepID=UPI00023ED252|nr:MULTISPECIES: TetR/AcrR family transcriptional regulator [unclassified Actinoplanes]AEV84956.1 HTH-type transcriptional regulator tcmR [Actinoplanes sp. SE50/110]ATO83347.1 TetR family transcriptional regulator [Actinoplanes sp. SE50]SLM00754.1 TetR family transcriptional regulator [Actinoplanes sp. SE50/110]